MRRIALGLAIVALLLSGCFGSSQRLNETEARDATQQAIEAFAADFASPTGGDLRMVRGEFGGPAETAGASDVTFELEWGLQERSRAEVHAAGGGVSYDVALHCSNEAVIITFGEERIERRPVEGSCLESMRGGGDPLEVGQLEDHDIVEVDAHRDGSVTALLESEGGNATVEVDRRGRLVRMEFSGQGGTGFVEVEYGARQAIAMPDATDRMPVLVSGTGSFADGRYEWNAAAGDESAPFDEVEVRILDGGTRMATLPARPGTHEAGGFTLTFVDDGDGAFGAGDSFTIQSAAWTSPEQYQVVVWDTWADAEVGDMPIPGVPVLALVAVVGLAVAARRR